MPHAPVPVGLVLGDCTVAELANTLSNIPLWVCRREWSVGYTFESSLMPSTQFAAHEYLYFCAGRKLRSKHLQSFQPKHNICKRSSSTRIC